MPRFYEKPYTGQVFRRRQHAELVEYGMIAGMAITGKFERDGVEMDAWTAILDSRLHGPLRLFHTNAWEAEGDWRPVPLEDLPFVPKEMFASWREKFLQLAERVEVLVANAVTEREEYLRLLARVDALTKTHVEVVAKPDPPPPARPSRTAAAQPSR